MQVTLAYPYEGHQPDETVDLPDDQARQMVHDGYARPAADAPPEAVAEAAAAVQVTTVAPPPAEVLDPPPQPEQVPNPEPVAGTENQEQV